MITKIFLGLFLLLEGLSLGGFYSADGKLIGIIGIIAAVAVFAGI